MNSLAFLVPGSIDQITGGYLYARRLVDGLRARGVEVAVHELPGRFPDADADAREACAAALAGLPGTAAVVIDGLALAGVAECLRDAARRLRLLALVHHPLAEETGLSQAESLRFAALESDLLPIFAGVICPSARTAQSAAEYGVDGARIAVVPPGTMKPAQPPRRGPNTGPVRLLSVATVTPRKGHRLLVEALASLGGPDWRLTIIGSLERDPETVAAVRAAIAVAGLGDRIVLAGECPQEALAASYEDADIFVLPSYHEGYGMAYAEALAFGLPIIATNAGAIPELVPRSAALLVQPGDVAMLAAALAHLIGDGALRSRLAAGAAAAGARLPGWQQVVEMWIETADRLLA